MKTTITNRNNINLAVVVENPEETSGLAFVVHGLGGFKEQVHMRTIADTFLEADYTVVTYDAANTIGESGGRMEDATLTNYFRDLEDITAWAATQDWYKEPFVVAGHSLGGASSLLYAAKYPDKVKAIVPVSAFTGIDLKEIQWQDKPENIAWKQQGYKLEESKGKPGVMKKIGWGFMEDAQTYDLRTNAPQITCPALFITGSEDERCAPAYQQQVIDKLAGMGKLHIIEGMDHNPSTPEHNDVLRTILQQWLQKATA